MTSPRPSSERSIRRLWIAATPAELARAPLHGAPAGAGPWPFFELDEDAGLVTGCGPAMAAAGLSWLLAQRAVENIVGLGIAGAYPGSHCRMGAAYRIRTERFLDLGAESGSSSGILALPFPGLDTAPMRLDSPDAFASLESAEGATVSLATGTARTALSRRATGADLESMEGAAWTMVARAHSIPFAQVRAVSNIAGPRAPGAWNVAGALDALGAALATLARAPE